MPRHGSVRYSHGSLPYSLPDLSRALGVNVEMHSATGVPFNLRPVAAPLPKYHRDYVRIAAWLFAFLFGPLLTALIVLLVV